MAVVATHVREEVDLPYGFNVLRNDARSAIGLAASCQGSFVRVNVHTGAMVTDQGVIQGKAAETIRARNQLCPQVEVPQPVPVPQPQFQAPPSPQLQPLLLAVGLTSPPLAQPLHQAAPRLAQPSRAPPHHQVCT